MALVEDTAVVEMQKALAKADRIVTFPVDPESVHHRHLLLVSSSGRSDVPWAGADAGIEVAPEVVAAMTAMASGMAYFFHRRGWF